MPRDMRQEGWQDLLHGQLQQDFQIANLSSCQRKGWQDLLHGQLEKVISIEKQGRRPAAGGCTQPLAFSSKEMTLFKTLK